MDKFDIASRPWYVKNTNAEVIVRNVEFRYSDTSDEKTAIVDIEFVEDNPDLNAIKYSGAILVPDYNVITVYSGHPVQTIKKYRARVSLDKLCEVPFGTKAAEVLFAKKE